jgi:hypothetical protein
VEPLPAPRIKPINKNVDLFDNWKAEEAARKKRDAVLNELRDWYRQNQSKAE